MLLFPVRSELATVKEGAASVKVATVLDENRQTQTTAALGLPESMFHGVPARFVTHYRQRAGK